MAKLSIRDLELSNKYLFVRVDFNVPLSESGLQILDDTRIKETLPTLEYALRHHAKVIVADYDSPGARVFVGSENFSSASLTRNRDLGLILSDATLIRSFHATLTRDFKEQRLVILGTTVKP